MKKLRKVEFTNVQDFVQILNHNFQILESSPLYKGVQGLRGIKGETGVEGTRGSRFLFVSYENWVKVFGNEIAYSYEINQTLVNKKLQNHATRILFASMFGLTELVDSDILVLSNSVMLRYDSTTNRFENTGFAFNQETNINNITTSTIESIAKKYFSSLSFDNNLPLELYETYAKQYTDASNIQMTSDVSHAVYQPLVTGKNTSRNGVFVDNHKFVGARYNNSSRTWILGNIERYIDLLNKTTSVASSDLFTNEYAPGTNNIPTLIMMQKSNNAGLLFGIETNANLRNFAALFRNDSGIVLRSSSGVDHVRDNFSELLIADNDMSYNKDVRFLANLLLQDKLTHNGEIASSYFRSGNSVNNAPINSLKDKTVEVGFESDSSVYSNVSNSIYLRKYLDTVLVTNSEGLVSKSYKIDNRDYLAFKRGVTSLNLNSIILNSLDTSKKYLITSDAIDMIIAKINAIQEHIKANYWNKASLKSNQNNTDKSNINMFSLAVENKFSAGNGNIQTNSATKETIIGSQDSFISKTNIYGKTLKLPHFASTTETNRVLVIDGNGTVSTKKFINEDITTKDTRTLSEDNRYIDRNTFVTANYFHYLVNRIEQANAGVNTNYWSKSDFKTGVIPVVTSKNINVPSKYGTDIKFTTLSNSYGPDNNIVSSDFVIRHNVSIVDSEYFHVATQHITFAQWRNCLLSTDDNGGVGAHIKVERELNTDGSDIFGNHTTSVPADFNYVITGKHFNYLLDIVNTTAQYIVDNYWNKESFKNQQIPKVSSVEGVFQELSTNNFVINEAIQTIDYKSCVFVTDSGGHLMNTYSISTDNDTIVNEDTNVPQNISDVAKSNQVTAKTNFFADNVIPTGRNMRWIRSFMNSVKKRFLNTFNKKETIDYVYDHMPAGSIIMWSKQSSVLAGIQGIPQGWAICDGTNGTPNLIGKFIKGSTFENSGVTSGSNTIKIQTKNLPPHSHKFKVSGYLNIMNNVELTVPVRNQFKPYIFDFKDEVEINSFKGGGISGSTTSYLRSIGLNNFIERNYIVGGSNGNIILDASAWNTEDYKYNYGGNHGYENDGPKSVLVRNYLQDYKTHFKAKDLSGLKFILSVTDPGVARGGANNEVLNTPVPTEQNQLFVTESEQNDFIAEAIDIQPEHYTLVFIMKMNSRKNPTPGFSEKYILV